MNPSSATTDPATADPPASPSPVRPGAGSRLPRGLAAFQHRDYRIFWFTQLGSLTGTWMQTLAQSWLVLTMTGSAFQLGLINVCQFGPTLILGLPGGVLADRIPKRRLLATTQSIAGGLTGILAIMVATGNVELWHIYATALGLGIVNSIDMPTRQAFVADLVGTDDLMNAVALNSALFNSTRIIGPAIAGLLLATVGAAACFIGNSASYVPVVLGLLAMRTQGAPADNVNDTSPLDRLRQGLRYVRATSAVLVPIALVGIIGVFGMNFNVWVPLLARRDFDIGAGGFGMLMSSLGVGSLTGALTLAFRGRQPQRGLMLTTAIIFGGVEAALALGAAVSVPLIVAMLLMAGAGFAMSTTMALANTIVQTTTPDELRGRVMSIYMTVFAGTAPLGSLIAGVTSNLLGTPLSVAIGGSVVLVASSILGFRWIGLEHLRRQPATAAAPAAPMPSRPAPRCDRSPRAGGDG